MFYVPSIPFDDAAFTFVVLAAIILLVPIASERVRIPGIVGLVLAGMVVGPGVAGLLEYEGAMRLLGEAGLLYLMFMAGLEIDLDEFAERRSHSIRFGSLGFLIPMIVGTTAIAAVGFPLLAAILLASCWASHTLLTYPRFRREGRIHNRAVSTSVGATVFTDTAALLVLVVVVRAQDGELGPAFWGSIGLSLAGLVFVTLWVLPRVGRWFFTEIAVTRGPRFIFCLVAVFGGGAVAELGGIEAIIGSFLAGLGMNRLVPNEGPLMERVEVLGDDFLIPIFLVSVGLLIDPAAIADPAQLAIAGVFVAVVLGTKLAAAGAAGWWFGFDRVEIGAMYGLTVAQAAATLAATVVGIEAGVLPAEVVNPVVLAILVACIVASLVSDRTAPRLPREERERAIGEVVVVPIARPSSAGPLARIAAAVAYADSGVVVPLTVAEPSSDADRIDAMRELSDEAEGLILDTGAEALPVLRIDTSVVEGVRHTLVEQKGSMLVMGWKGYRPRREALFGSIIDPLLAEATVPTVVGRLERSDYARIVLVVTESNLTPGGRPGLLLALEVARRLRSPGDREQRREVVVVTNAPDEQLGDLAEELLDTEVSIDRRKRTEILPDVVEEDDLVIVPVKLEREGMRGAPSRIAQLLPGNPLLVALDHSGTITAPLARRAGPVEEPVDESVEDEVEEMADDDRAPAEVEGAEPGRVDVDEHG
jgi:Kef-type K+ transport system membrane component KefB